MTELLVLLLVVVVVAAALATLRDVYHDGSGRTDPPRSHEPDPFEPGSPHRFA